MCNKMSRHHLLLSGAAILVALYATLPATDAIAIRPFNCKKPASGCSTETALSSLGCPCKLNGQRCFGPSLLATEKLQGVICIDNVCQCGRAFISITNPTTKVTSCYNRFFATPTIAETVDSTVPGVLVLCGLGLNEPIPGYNITFLNAMKPVNCDSTILKLVEVSSNDPTTLDPAATDLTCPAPPLTLANANGFCPYVQIDGQTGAVIPNNQEGIAPVVSAPGTFYTQSYQGFCVGANGITSNTFVLKVTWTNCDNDGDPTAAVTTFKLPA